MLNSAYFVTFQVVEDEAKGPLAVDGPREDPAVAAVVRHGDPRPLRRPGALGRGAPRLGHAQYDRQPDRRDAALTGQLERGGGRPTDPGRARDPRPRPKRSVHA